MSVRSFTRRLLKRAIGHVLNWGLNSALFWGITAVFFGGIIHIFVIMSLPYLATRSAWTQLKPITLTNKMSAIQLQIDGSEMPLPLMTPDIRYAICRYDVTKGSLLIQANLLDDHWSVAIYGRHGENYYVINGRDVQRSEVELLLSTSFKPKTNEDAKTTDGQSGDGIIKVSAADQEGFIVVRAPLLGASFAQRAENGLNKASCNLQL